jgi:hypothetical protein
LSLVLGLVAASGGGLVRKSPFAYSDSVPTHTREVRPAGKPGFVLLSSGEELRVPSSWCLVAPGDAALTRRIKKAGPTWSMSEKKGRKVFSLGVYAPASTVAAIRDELSSERADPKYLRKLEAGRARRARDQLAYAAEFQAAVYDFLSFAHRHDGVARTLAGLIAAHATPVGSGTVARTKRIPIERRAEAATIAWMRHQTTAYDEMKIARVKGTRREVRRMLAQHSRGLLEVYRRGGEPGPRCPLGGAVRELLSAD